MDMVQCDRCHRKFATYAALKQHYVNQHTNAKWPDKFESKLSEEQSIEAYKSNLHPTRSSHTKLIIAVVLILIVAGAGVVYLPNMLGAGSGGSGQCASFPFPPIGDQSLAEHYHDLLLLYVNDAEVNIPPNVGEGDAGPCTQPLHVHVNAPGTNVIHIESPQLRSYTLGDFFKVWSATPNLGPPTPVVFNQNQIFSNSIGNGYELRMYVNGKPSAAYDSLVLQDHMIIVVVYGNSATDWPHYQALSAQPWPFPNY
jgi:hypothetical protein